MLIRAVVYYAAHSAEHTMIMTSQSEQSVGPRERQLLRRRGNPLFPAQRRLVSDSELNKARAEDEAQREEFMERFQALVQRAVDLKPNEESDTILALKADLDRAYTECSALSGDNGKVLDALRRLVEVTMGAVRSAAGPDPTAVQELEQEEMARRTNYELLRHPLVADLMLPRSPVEEDELVPTLLSEAAEAVDAALWLFEREHLGKLVAEGRELLATLEAQGQRPPEPWARLEQMEQAAGSGTDR
jgi:hypothetical protein